MLKLHAPIVVKRLILIVSSFISITAFAANEVGSLPGEFSVSPSGAATYSVPIDVPPGINGLKPTLAFVYNSQSGNGLLGQGWGLSGLSSITRCPQTLEQDNNIHGVDFSDEDRLCLDGQRLVPVNGTSYWNASEYRTEIESFSKVTWFGTGFKVETKDGRVAEYGNTVDSEQNMPGVVGVLSWSVNKISDQFYNSISYVYNEDVNTGEHTISEITYANSASVKFNYESRNDTSFGFIAGGKFSQNNRLKGVNVKKGGQSVFNYLLSYEVAVGSDISRLLGIEKCSNADCLPMVDFSWRYASQKETNFNFQKTLPGALEVNNSYLNTSYNNIHTGDFNGDGKIDMLHLHPSADRKHSWVALSNGDGTFDFQRSLPGASTSTRSYLNTSYNNIHTGDFDGDGLTDMLHLHPSSNKIYSWVALSNGDGSFDFKNGTLDLQKGLPGASTATNSFLNTAYRNIQTGDFNGDGLTDMLHLHPSSNKIYSWVALSNGDGTFDFQQRLPGASVATESFLNTADQTIQMGDFNGDGLTDMLHLHPSSNKIYSWVALSNGDGSFDFKQRLPGASTATDSFLNTADRTIQTGDFNGDGLTDMLHLHPSSNKIYSWVALSKGDGSFDFKQRLPGASTATDSFLNTAGPNIHTGDFNGDGLTDMLHMHPNGSTSIYSWIALSDGDGTFTFKKTLPAASANADSFLNTSYKDIYTGDYNGDGLTDMLHYHPVSDPNFSWVALSNGYDINTLADLSEGTDANLMVSVDNGLGNITAIKHQPITNNAVYTKDSSSSYPVMGLQTSTQVVNRVSTDNGIGGQNTTTYKYGGMKAHLRGLGSLGFRQMEVTNDQTGIKTKTDFSQQYPNIGAPVKTVVSQANNWILSSSVNNYTYNGYTCLRYPVAGWALPNCANNEPGIVYPYSVNSSSSQYDLNRKLLKTVTTNSTLGNYNDNFVDSTFTTITTRGPTGAEFKQVTNNTFGNSYSSIYSHKGQLTQSQSYTIDNGNYSPTISKTYTYNTKGLLFTDTLEAGTSDELIKTYLYDNFGNRKSVEIKGADITKRTSSTVYDANGQFPKLITNALGHSETHVYDSRFGSLKSRTGPNNLTTTYETDNFGRKSATLNARGNRSEVSREWCNINYGHVCTIPAINTSNSVLTTSQTVSYIVTSRQKRNSVEYVPPAKVYFDKFNREVRRESTGYDGVAVYVDTNYDSQGRVVAKTQPYFSDNTSTKNPTSYVYDVLGRVTQQYLPAGTRNEIIYNGLVLKTNSYITNPSRMETKTETTNAIGQLVSVIDNAYQTTSFSYNPQGKRTATSDPQGNVITIEYDKLGRKKFMTDPDMGYWVYTYNVLGELVTQKDAKQQVTSMQYDLLGRVTRRNDHDGLVSAWYYNDNGGTSSRNKAVGKLDYVTSSNGYRKDLYYNNYGEPTTSVVAISGAGSSSRTDTSYDAYGRINTLTYPESIGRFQVKHAYKNGFLEKVTSTDNAITYWKADLRRANGQVQHDRYGANLQVSRDFDSGERINWLNISGSAMLYEAYYGYDSIGNITSRSSQRNQGSRLVFDENYTYDNLNRLTDVEMVGLGSITRSYDALGNIESKNNNSYTYYANRPHAVKTALGNAYNYDANGNMINGAGRSINWTSHNKPSQIVKGSSYSNFLYGPSRKRFSHQQSNGIASQNKTTYYIGKLFEKEVKGSVTEYKHYILGGGKTIAVHTRKSGVANKTDYLLRDYQGTVVAIADETGNIKGHMDYDAFGARRPVLGLSQIDQLIQSFPRGYTGHEHLDNVGLVHMNGRVYDAELGRFLSADPLVQAPNNLQSLNRYSYVFNNPMSYTDPSGFRSLKKKIRNALKYVAANVFPGATLGYKLSNTKAVTRFFLKHKWAQIAGQVLASVYGGPAGSAGFSAYLTDISGGSLKDVLKNAAIAYVTAEAFNRINAQYGKTWNSGRVIDNGLVGGLSSELSGGKFRDGFKMSAGLASFQLAFNKITLAGERAHLVPSLGGAEIGEHPFAKSEPIYTINDAGKIVTLKNTMGLELLNYDQFAFGSANSIGTGSEAWFSKGIISSYNTPLLHEISLMHDIGLGFLGHGQVANWVSMPFAAAIVIGGYAGKYQSAIYTYQNNKRQSF